MPPIVIGLVGGIASGKSSVARMLMEERRMLHLDADEIAREVSNRPRIKRAIQERFPQAVDRKGKINRRLLAQRVFGDPGALADLEAIVHPPIRRGIVDALQRADEPWVLLDAALLQESGADQLCDAVVYVACPVRRRRARARRDRGWTDEEHAAREARQWSCRRKRARADYALDNGGAPETTRRQLGKLLAAIERAARKPKKTSDRASRTPRGK
jgi:dephospho-CoA kinase